MVMRSYSTNKWSRQQPTFFNASSKCSRTQCEVLAVRMSMMYQGVFSSALLYKPYSIVIQRRANEFIPRLFATSNVNPIICRSTSSMIKVTSRRIKSTNVFVRLGSSDVSVIWYNDVLLYFVLDRDTLVMLASSLLARVCRHPQHEVIMPTLVSSNRFDTSINAVK